MTDRFLSWWLGLHGYVPCLEVFGKGRAEKGWRLIRIFGGKRRNRDSRWPLVAGTCTTWSSTAIAVGWDFAVELLAEHERRAVTTMSPVEVGAGRLRDQARRREHDLSTFCTAAEIMAHECGHTAQAVRLGPAYLPIVGSVTLFREGPRIWNHWENDASENGLYGGIARFLLEPDLWPVATDR